MDATLNVLVVPFSNGWAVECDGVCERLTFLSGARAELQARKFAIALSRAGSDALVQVHDRMHEIVGTGLYFAMAELEPAI